MIRRDDQRVREALAARLADTDDTTRAEAIRGLAVRHDDRAIPQLLSELDRRNQLDDPAILEEALCALAAYAPDDDLCLRVDRRVSDWQAASPNRGPSRRTFSKPPAAATTTADEAGGWRTAGGAACRSRVIRGATPTRAEQRPRSGCYEARMEDVIAVEVRLADGDGATT